MYIFQRTCHVYALKNTWNVENVILVVYFEIYYFNQSVRYTLAWKQQCYTYMTDMGDIAALQSVLIQIFGDQEIGINLYICILD